MEVHISRNVEKILSEVSKESGFNEEEFVKRAVLGFDQLNDGNFPGETIALKEVFGLDKFEIQRSPISPLQSYIIIK
jgi:hypothetical protein